jgi:hypothetical protein
LEEEKTIRHIYIAITNAIIEDVIISLTSEAIKKLKEVKWFLFFVVAISLT